MSRIDEIFTALRAQGRSGLMPFITGGYPSLEVTRRVLPEFERAGASAVEIGFPFSDPIADGPVIAASMHEALGRGVTPRSVFEVVQSVGPDLDIGLIAMVSASILARVGEERFVRDARQAGFDGLIVPDADTSGGCDSPAGCLAALSKQHDLTCTFLIAPTTSSERMESIFAISSGFIYLLARVGITGEREQAPPIEERVAMIRRHTDLPIAVGFGISSPEHVAAVTKCADAAIVGSALVRRMGAAEDPVAASAEFIRKLAAALSTRTPVR